jgi:hypothetical protein
MKKTLLNKKIMTLAVVGAIGQTVHASGHHLPAPITADTFAAREAIRMADIIRNQVVSEPDPAANASQALIEDVSQGNHTNVKGGAVTQNYKKDVAAQNKVEQGNISGGEIGGKVTQKFIGSTTAREVAQGNISGTTIDGDIEQEF